MQHFTSSKCYYKTSLSLFSLKQGSEETLRKYIQRFNQVTLHVPIVALEALVSPFSQGSMDGDFFQSLVKKPPTNYDDLFGRAKKYISV